MLSVLAVFSKFPSVWNHWAIDVYSVFNLEPLSKIFLKILKLLKVGVFEMLCDETRRFESFYFQGDS